MCHWLRQCLWSQGIPTLAKPVAHVQYAAFPLEESGLAPGMELLSANRWFALTLIAGLGIGAVVFRRLRGQPRAPRWLAAVAPSLIGVCLLALATLAVRAPHTSWNATRLAPLVGLKYGYPLYCSVDHGPILPTIYPPGAYLPYAPALLASTPTAAVLIGTTLSMVYFLFPPALILLAGSGRRAATDPGALGACRSGHIAIGLWGWCCFAGLALRSPATRDQLACVHADAPCLAAMGMACAWLYLAKRPPRTAALLGSAVFAVLAVWCKQTAVPVLAALPLYVLLTWGWRPCALYTLLAALAGSLIGLAMVLWIGFDVLRWHLITIPASQGFDPPGIRGLGAAAAKMAGQSWPLWVALAAILIVQCGPRALRSGGIRAWLAGNRWAIFPWLGLFLLPTGLLGMAKIGGDINSLHSVYFWLCGVVVFAVETARGATRSTVRPFASRTHNWIWQGVVLLTLLPIAWGSLRMVRGALDLPTRLRQLSTNPQQVAYEFAKAHPRQGFFPWNPLSTLMADGKLYHHDYAVLDWDYAHRPPSRARLEPDMPAAMQWIIIQPTEREKFFYRAFPEFSQAVKLPGLPRWPAFAREGGEGAAKGGGGQEEKASSGTPRTQ